MEITVQKKKKSVVVLDWGNAPFGVESNLRGKVYIPSGFKVETVAARKVWVGTTRVADGMTQYRFHLKDDPKKCSDWKKSSSGAFRQVNERVKNVHFKRGTNGALIMGVTYPPLQTEILNRFGIKLLEAASPTRNVQDDEENEVEDDFEEEKVRQVEEELPTTNVSKKRKLMEPQSSSSACRILEPISVTDPASMELDPLNDFFLSPHCDKKTSFEEEESRESFSKVNEDLAAFFNLNDDVLDFGDLSLGSNKE